MTRNCGGNPGPRSRNSGGSEDGVAYWPGRLAWGRLFGPKILRGGEMENTFLLHILAMLLVVIGLAGLVLPVLPGALLIFGGLFLAAWADQFQYLGAGSLGVLAVLALATYAVDFAASAFGARRFGASSRAAIGAGIGAFVGLFFGLPGVLLGPFLGAMIGEFSARQNLEAASRAGVGATLGLVVGAALKLALAFSMLALYGLMRYSPFG